MFTCKFTLTNIAFDLPVKLNVKPDMVKERKDKKLITVATVVFVVING